MMKKVETEMFNIISLGAGVQSSCLALMAAMGLFGIKIHACIFADVGDEPKNVYKWLYEFLIPELEKYGVKVYVVRHSQGKTLGEQGLEIRKSKRSGKHYIRSYIPFHTKDSTTLMPGILLRKCTQSFKIDPIIKFIRKFAEIKRGEKEVRVIQWMGISLDEAHRQKPSRVPWIEHRYPLIEKNMTRGHCLEWMKDNGFPVPPRSACVFCPYHSDKEWVRLRDEEPEEFQKAVEYEKEVRKVVKENDEVINSEIFLHNSHVPLDEVKFDVNNTLDMFGNECEGMCGM